MNSKFVSVDDDLKTLRDRLHNNGFGFDYIDKLIKTTLNKLITKDYNSKPKVEDKSGTKFLKLPYTPLFKDLKKLFNENVKLISTSLKTISFFQTNALRLYR